MTKWKYNVALLLLIMFIVGSAEAQTTNQSLETPSNFKIAFIGDQGLGENAEAVLRLIKREGAKMVLHMGDFDYDNNPAAWDTQINKILGTDLPYFACRGNHDVNAWGGTNGYQHYLEKRLNGLGITWDGDLGVKSSIHYKGILFILVDPGGWWDRSDVYIKNQLAEDKFLWRICCWHKNMRLMQVAGKKDDTGWGVYEEARRGGAIIATAHDHSYGRTYLMDSFVHQTIASRSNTMTITEGKTFAFFTGLGGKSVYAQELNGSWWANIYTRTQGATYGALFGVFKVDGAPNKATFYFKNIKGEIIDRFDVISNVHINATEEK